jgi:hypothetical protein
MEIGLFLKAPKLCQSYRMSKIPHVAGMEWWAVKAGKLISYQLFVFNPNFPLFHVPGINIRPQKLPLILVSYTISETFI